MPSEGSDSDLRRVLYGMIAKYENALPGGNATDLQYVT